MSFFQNASYIVMRNIADYANAPVPAITPANFIALGLFAALGKFIFFAKIGKTISEG